MVRFLLLKVQEYWIRWRILENFPLDVECADLPELPRSSVCQHTFDRVQTYSPDCKESGGYGLGTKLRVHKLLWIIEACDCWDYSHASMWPALMLQCSHSNPLTYFRLLTTFWMLLEKSIFWRKVSPVEANYDWIFVRILVSTLWHSLNDWRGAWLFFY